MQSQHCTMIDHLWSSYFVGIKRLHRVSSNEYRKSFIGYGKCGYSLDMIDKRFCSRNRVKENPNQIEIVQETKANQLSVDN